MVNISRTKEIRKVQRTFNQNVSSIDLSNPSQAIDALTQQVQDLQNAVLELQSKTMAASSIEDDGFPSHGSSCGVLDAQFLRLTQGSVAPYDVEVTHGLGRVPQGVINIQSSMNALALIAGDVGVLPATDTTVTIRLMGIVSEVHILVLF